MQPAFLSQVVRHDQVEKAVHDPAVQAPWTFSPTEVNPLQAVRLSVCILALLMGLVASTSPYFGPGRRLQVRKANSHRHSLACAEEDLQIAEAAVFSSPEVVQKLLKTLSGVESGSWLQIGANTLDPTDNHNDPFMLALPGFSSYNKYFVEPIPAVFEKLQKNTADIPNSLAVNVAILPNNTVQESTVDMYCVEDKEVDNLWWANQICSFNEEHIARHRFNSFKKVEVLGLSFPELIRRHNIHNVRILLIDVEGFDAAVLRQLPFDEPSFRPTLIAYERIHLSESDEAASVKLLRDQCYLTFEDVENVYALAV